MIAELQIQTKLLGDSTCLKKSYFTPPFKIADIREDKKQKTLHLMLMSSSPGILDGDEYKLLIELEKGCSLRLSTQSYQRLFTMNAGATQNFDVRMQPDSAFCYLPHPTVPHERSSFKTVNNLFLSDGCSLIWGEILTCGRKLKDEIFTFSKYHSITQIFLNGKLIIKENLLIEPAKIDVKAIGQLENYTHQANLIYLNEQLDFKQLKEEVNAFLATQTGITFGITETQKPGMLIRILGFEAEQLHNSLTKIAEIVDTQKPISIHA